MNYNDLDRLTQLIKEYHNENVKRYGSDVGDKHFEHVIKSIDHDLHTHRDAPTHKFIGWDEIAIWNRDPKTDTLEKEVLRLQRRIRNENNVKEDWG